MRWLDFLIPRRCGACNDECSNEFLCARCSESLYENSDACPRCALPRASHGTHCLSAASPLKALSSPYLYGAELAVALQRIKYRKNAEAAWALGRWMSPALSEFLAAQDADFMVPIPSHWRSRLSRGMDHVIEILRGTKTPVETALILRKSRHTARQAGLPRHRRLGNVAKSFRVHGRWKSRIQGKRIVLVDDVATTLATLHAAAEPLAECGCAAISAFAVARAEP